MPFTLEYWHIGETKIRFLKVTSRSRKWRKQLAHGCYNTRSCKAACLLIRFSYPQYRHGYKPHGSQRRKHRLAIGVFKDGALLIRLREFRTTARSEWPRAIAEAWAKIAELDEPEVAGISVNPPLVESLEHVVVEQTGHSLKWVGSEIDLPIKVRTQQPKETGIDRIVNIAAAYEQMGKACVVVDAGTAITVDCCNDAGEFLGGSISPGVEMMLESLHARAAKLPRDI